MSYRFTRLEIVVSLWVNWLAVSAALSSRTTMMIGSASHRISSWAVPPYSSSIRQHDNSHGVLITCAASSDEADRLRESASRLRQEADDLREQLLTDGNPRIKRYNKDSATVPINLSYKSLAESLWIMTYRFSSDPRDDDNDTSDTGIPNPVSSYSGKLSVKFRSDGYTDLVAHKPTGATSLTVEKVWGWDEETSNEDDLQYVLFSVNVKLPKDDSSMPGQLGRFYWQAQVRTDASTDSISLVDGTVTVKKDVKPPGGFWGIFDGGGILAQFRYVGNFVAKPTAET